MKRPVSDDDIIHVANDENINYVSDHFEDQLKTANGNNEEKLYNQNKSLKCLRL